MKTFLADLIDSVKRLIVTALYNAKNNPRTTASGVGSIVGGMVALKANPKDTAVVTTAVTGILVGAGLILADDPGKRSITIEDNRDKE